MAPAPVSERVRAQEPVELPARVPAVAVVAELAQEQEQESVRVVVAAAERAQEQVAERVPVGARARGGEQVPAAVVVAAQAQV